MCILATAGLAVCLMFERQACRKLDAQNNALRRQLGKMAELAAENQRLSNLLAQASAPRGATGANVATDERLEELARLRGQIEALHQQGTNVESLRADTRATHDKLEQARQALHAQRMANRNHSATGNGAPLQILQASYGTDRTNLDVSAELGDRIRGGGLKVIASNRLAGDPDFGNVKSLTIVYRFGGTVVTNQFREGDAVILPPESP